MEPFPGADPVPAARSALPTYLGFAAALAVFALVLQWFVGRREIAAAHDHQQAVERAAAEPGTAVTDPAIPPGVLLVDLVPVSPDLPIEEPATLRAGGQRARWTVDAPARFEGLPGERRLPLVISGPCAVESISISAPTGSRGARVAVRAIPVLPPRRFEYPPGWTPEKRLEVDLDVRGSVRLVWKVGMVVIAETSVPRASGPAVAARIRDEWKAQRNHADVADKKLDQAIVRVTPTDSFEDILFLVQALLSPRREMNRDGERRNVAVFNVTVQPRFQD